jgi:2-C-methyl-D-erythritol 4-phosphate cytidylyltransferase
VSTVCVILAAGQGERFGADRPKQLVEVAGRRLVDWSLLRAAEVGPDCVLVTADGLDPGGSLPAVGVPGRLVVVAGGVRRSDSVRAALEALREVDDRAIVVVHDAARPCASDALFRSVVSAVEAGADGAVPGVPLTDTVKRVRDDAVVETLDRDELVAVQTPQAFRAGVLRRAHAEGADATDDAALVEAIGGRVVVVTGEDTNVKVTRPSDISLVERVLS